MRIIKSLLLSLLLICPAIFADGGGSGGDSGYSHLSKDFIPATNAIEAKNFQAAVKHLEKLKQTRNSDADVFNLLGYSHRKLKDYSQAEEYYSQALSIEPEHKGANEYLGQLYLETDRLKLAEERLKVLKKASFLPNSQYRKLKKSIKAYKKKQG